MANVPIPPKRPPAPIPRRRPNPNSRPPSGGYEDEGGNQNRETIPAAVPRAQQPAAAQPTRVGSQGPAGLIEPGNIDLNGRTPLQNEDGSISTLSSFSVNIDGREVLLPSITRGGQPMSEEEAIANYQNTGEHLGVFDSPEHATQFAERLHQDQDDLYGAGAATVDQRLAEMQRLHTALRASIPITPVSATPPAPPSGPLAALRARVDTTFRMPTGIPYEQMRQSSIRAWERWAETGAGTSEPPVMDPPGTPGLWIDQWEQRRTQESTSGILAELGLAP